MAKSASEGENPDLRILNWEVNNECPLCKNPTVILTERRLVEGDLDLYFAIHTEVEDTFECRKCKNTWKENSFM